MSRPYRQDEAIVYYECARDEAAVMARTTQRRDAYSRHSGKPRSMYGQRHTPFTDDLMMSLYAMHRYDAIAPKVG